MCDNICGVTEPERPTASTALRYIRKRELSSHSDESKISEAIGQLIVTGGGTKLMKSFQLPTVLIRVCNGALVHSTVYHALLEFTSANYYSMRVIAIMYSDPSSCKRTQCAELLPLSVELDSRGSLSIVPTLSKPSYTKLFCKGSFWKVLALGCGRFINSSETLSWKQYRPQCPAMRRIITEILTNDIMEMPASMINSAANTRATYSSIQGCSSSLSFSRAGLHDNNSCDDTLKNDLSEYYPSLRFRGVAASGGSSFAKWFKLIPPTVRVDTNFKCDRGTTLRKDRFCDAETLNRYLRPRQVE